MTLTLTYKQFKNAELETHSSRVEQLVTQVTTILLDKAERDNAIAAEELFLRSPDAKGLFDETQ